MLITASLALSYVLKLTLRQEVTAPASSRLASLNRIGLDSRVSFSSTRKCNKDMPKSAKGDSFGGLRKGRIAENQRIEALKL